MADGSSDSDTFNITRVKTRPQRYRNDNNTSNNAVEVLASTLQDTNRNLRTVDKMLDSYKEYGEQQSTAMDKLRDDLARTTERLKMEKIRKARREASKSPVRGQRDHSGRRYPTSPLKDYDYDKAASDNEYGAGPSSPSRRRNFRNAVRFHDDMDADESMHDLHQSIRDLYSGQIRLEDDVQRNVHRSTRFEHESSKAMKAISNSLKSNTVEQRLQSLQQELSTERQMLQRNQDDVGNISTKLSQALQEKKVNKEENSALKSHLSVLETEKTVVDKELAHARTRLCRIDGAKSSLSQQVEELRRALLRSEDSKQKLLEQIDKQDSYIREEKRRQSMQTRDKDFKENETKRMQDEVKDLRHQLNKSAGALGEYGELRKELDRSEKQRQQLSDHIEVLGKDMDERERQSAKLVTQLQTVTDKFNVVDRQRDTLENSLEEAIRKLKETGKQSEDAAVSLRDTQQQLYTSQQKNQELKFKALDTVKQWKSKCKKLEKELSVYRHSTEQAVTRAQQLNSELQATKHQASLTAQQTDHIKREFTTLLAIRAQQEEQLRIRDIQVNELKSFKCDMEKDLRDCKTVIDRLEHELHVSREKSSVVFDDRHKYEESMRTMQQSSVLAQTQLAQLQRELKELNLVRVELAAKLAASSTENTELRAVLKEARYSEDTSRGEIDQLLRRIKGDKNLFNGRLEGILHELGYYRNGESHKLLQMTHARKKQQAEYEAELQVVRLDLQNEQSNSTLLKRQSDKLKLEIERLNSKLASVEDDLRESQKQYHMVRGEFMSRTEATEDGLYRSKQLELDLLDKKESFRRALRDNHNILNTIAAEIDAVVEVATMGSIETYKALSFTKHPSDPNGILAEVKSKLSWLKQDLRERRELETRLRSDRQQSMTTNDNRQHNTLLNEISRQNDIVEQMMLLKRDNPGTQPYDRGTYRSDLYSTANYTDDTAPYSSPLLPSDSSTPHHLAKTDTIPSEPSTFTAQMYNETSAFRTPASTFRHEPYRAQGYDSEAYSTPMSTDTELQLDDLSVVPERLLSKAQVFEAMEKLTSSATTESDSAKTTEQSDDSVLRKTQEERDRIHERYAQLQGTLNSLREELSDQPSQTSAASSLRDSRASRSTTRELKATSPPRRPARRVRISSPPTAEFSPVRRSNPSSRETTPRRSLTRDSPSRRLSSHDRTRSADRNRSPSLRDTRRSTSLDRSPDQYRHSASESRGRILDRSPGRGERRSDHSSSHKRSTGDRPVSPYRRDTSLDRRRSPSRRVLFDDTSPSRRRSRHDASPLQLSPTKDKSNPIMLTDEEFAAKFLPKSPEGLRQLAEAIG